MPVIVILNRKGGSGKSTLATHLAAYAANHFIPVMLGDIDKQQSSRTWLTLRQKTTQATMPTIAHWTSGEGRLPTVPNGAGLLILDTPGGLQGLELAKVVMLADVILMPVCNALFDRSSAADCIEELRRLPKLASGKCKLGVIGMRIDSQTGGAAEIANWARAQKVEYITHLRQSRLYVTCIEQGLTIFDAPPNIVNFDLVQWRPILSWLETEFEAARQSQLAAERRHTTYKLSPTEGVLNGASNGSLNASSNGSSPRGAAPQNLVKKGFFASLSIPEFLKK